MKAKRTCHWEESENTASLPYSPRGEHLERVKKWAQIRSDELRKQGKEPYTYIRIKGQILWGFKGFKIEAHGANEAEVKRLLGVKPEEDLSYLKSLSPKAKLRFAFSELIARTVKSKEDPAEVGAELSRKLGLPASRIAEIIDATKYAKLGVNPLRAIRLAKGVA